MYESDSTESTRPGVKEGPMLECVEGVYVMLLTY